MMLKIAVLAIISVILARALEGKIEGFSFILVIAAAIVIAVFILGYFSDIGKDIFSLLEYTPAGLQSFSVLFKSLAISWLAQSAVDVCEDAGYHALSTQIVLAAKVMILTISLPLIKQIFEISMEMINQ